MFKGLRFRMKKTDAPSSKEKAERLLPFDVLYAINHNECKMGESEARLLVRDFPSLAGYVYLKLATMKPSEHQKRLQKLLHSYTYDDSEGEDGVLSPQREHLARIISNDMKDDEQQGMSKVAIISRWGVAFWNELNKKMAEEIFHQNAAVFIVGNSMFVGLRAFANAQVLSHKPLYILMPEFLKDQSITHCGYIVENGDVKTLSKDFIRPQGAVIIDDINNTGSTEKILRDFWRQQGSVEEPRFDYISRTAGA